MFSTRSDIFLESALVLAAGVALLTLLLLGLIVALRWRRAHELRRVRSFEKRWRPVLMAASSRRCPSVRIASSRVARSRASSMRRAASWHFRRRASALRC